MDATIQLNHDRVREHISLGVKQEIDQQTQNNIRQYSAQGPAAVSARINQLNKEWDVERSLADL